MSMFSSTHRLMLVNEFWTRGSACCPLDGARLEAHYHPHSSDYLLVLACARCGHKAQVTRYSDPQRPAFRAWTASERASLIDAHRAGDPAACPVCASPLRPRDASGWEMLACPRCGNSAPLSHAAAPRCTAAALCLAPA